MAKPQHKFLIWDFDGTLAWRPGGWSGALLTVLRRSKSTIKATPEQIRPFLQSGFPWHASENDHPGLSAADWWEDLLPVLARAYKGIGVPGPEAIKLARGVQAVYTDPTCWQRYDDTLPALEKLSAKGWKHILLSNHVPELPILLERLDLKKHLAKVFNSAETGYEKPNHHAFRAVLDWMGPNATTWMIGDSYHVDILGAQEMGMSGILVRTPHPEAAVYYETLTELAEKL